MEFRALEIIKETNTRLEAWGWSSAWEQIWETTVGERTRFRPARVLSQREDTYFVATAEGLQKVTPAGVLFHRCSREALPAVGDWVIVEFTGDDGVITGILPRASRLLRQASGGRGVAQLVATNVDRVFVVVPVHDLNPNRLERYLVAICAGGSYPGILLSKVDLVSDGEVRVGIELLRGLMDQVPVLAISSKTMSAGKLFEHLEPFLDPKRTNALVGSSGAGKSTLLNALYGAERQVTAEIRASDGKGRHATSFREIFALPNGSLMMDTPGMREFALWSDDGGVERVFRDITDLELACRFADCEHRDEPDCAVHQAVVEGTLSARRVENWRVLKSEMAANADRRQLQEARRERGDFRRKKKRDERFSSRRR